MSHKKGFTLLELLIVVAIIGLLAAVVIAALGNANKKGGDAGVKANLRNAVSQGEIFYGTNIAVVNAYTNVCTNGVVGGAIGVGSFVLAAAKANGYTYSDTNGTGNRNPTLGGTLTTATCNDSPGAWAAEVPLKSVSGMWCVDSVGKSKQEPASIGMATTCS